MDFGSLSGRSSKSRDGSIKRKQSNTFLGAFRKSSQPPSSFNPPPLPPPTATLPPLPPSASGTASEKWGQPRGLPFDDNEEPWSPAESSRSHAPGSAWQTVMDASNTGSSEWGAKTASIRGREGSVRGAEGSVGRSGMPSGDRPRERAPSRKYSLSEARQPDKEKEKGAVVKRPEDLVKVVKDRMFSWSYMMTWYQGDSHWFNTVKIPRSAVEAFLGKQLEIRARNYYILGMSLGMLFEISGAIEFLRALIRVLEEWETMSEGGSKMKNLFKGQRSRKSSGSGDFQSLHDDSLYSASVPFALDFFQVHANLCSIMRDVYKRILKSFLPGKPSFSASESLVHPSTIIYSADTPPLPTHAPSASISSAGRPPSIRSPSQKSTTSTQARPGLQRKESETSQAYTSMTEAGSALQSRSREAEYDAFQRYILGELPPDRTLVGDGQSMSKEVIELFARADGKLRKHFSVLLRETDSLARRVLDGEISSVLDSFAVGSQPLHFDVGAAVSPTAGNGYIAQR